MEIAECDCCQVHYHELLLLLKLFLNLVSNFISKTVRPAVLDTGANRLAEQRSPGQGHAKKTPVSPTWHPHAMPAANRASSADGPNTV
jgi:hypothetical protein